jgi:hypothetical protein
MWKKIVGKQQNNKEKKNLYVNRIIWTIKCVHPSTMHTSATLLDLITTQRFIAQQTNKSETSSTVLSAVKYRTRHTIKQTKHTS